MLKVLKIAKIKLSLDNIDNLVYIVLRNYLLQHNHCLYSPANQRFSLVNPRERDVERKERGEVSFTLQHLKCMYLKINCKQNKKTKNIGRKRFVAPKYIKP